MSWPGRDGFGHWVQRYVETLCVSSLWRPLEIVLFVYISCRKSSPTYFYLSMRSRVLVTFVRIVLVRLDISLSGMQDLEVRFTRYCSSIYLLSVFFT